MSRLRRLLMLLGAIGALSAAPAASAAPGDLDASFGSGGSVRLLTSEQEAAIHAVAVQPDLKIVLAGSEDPGSVILVRLLPNGALDPTFGVGGKVVTPFPGGFGEARAIALQPDGKIVIAGAARGALTIDFLVARYNPDGSPDAGFGGGDGVELVPVGLAYDSGEAVAIGAGGRILVTGESEGESGQEGAGVVVLKADGTPDSAFAGSGRTIVDVTADDSDSGEAIAGLPDGRILVGDSTGDGAGDGFTLVQLLPSGAPDPGFGGGDGFVNTPIPGAPGAGGRLTDFVRRADGRIVASGYGFEEVNMAPDLEGKFAAVGYLPDGQLDPSFAGSGIFTRKLSPETDLALGVELAPSGKLLLAGAYEAAPNNQSVALLRLDPLGAVDPAFGSGGQVLRGVTAPFGEIFQGAALEAEERLVVASTAYTGGGVTTVVVSRYLGDPRPQAAPPPPVNPPRFNLPPHAQMEKVPRSIAAKKLKGFSGTATDPDGSVQRVEIALVRRVVKRGAKKARLLCFALKAKSGFKQVKRQGKKCPQRWLAVKGTTKWGFRLKGKLPSGRYVVFARATDGQGKAETKFSRKLGNRYGFRVLP